MVLGRLQLRVDVQTTLRSTRLTVLNESAPHAQRPQLAKTARSAPGRALGAQRLNGIAANDACGRHGGELGGRNSARREPKIGGCARRGVSWGGLRPAGSFRGMLARRRTLRPAQTRGCAIVAEGERRGNADRKKTAEEFRDVERAAEARETPRLVA